MRRRRRLGGLRASLAVLALAGGALANAAPARDLRLVEAVQRSDRPAIALLLRQRMNVNARQPDGSTALLWAAYAADAETVDALLLARADPNLPNHYGITPLLQACRVGNSRIASALIRHGAKLDTAYADGETLLMAAAASGADDMVKLLASRGFDVNASEHVEDQTALMWAAAGGHLAVVRTLIAAGADANRKAKINTLSYPTGDQGRAWTDHSQGGLTALMFATRQGSADVVRTLVEEGHADPNIRTPGSVTALLIAILNDRLDLADYLLDHGAEANDGSLYELINLRALRVDATAGDDTRPRPIHENSVNTLQLLAKLLDRGADPNVVPSYQLRVEGKTAARFPAPISNSAYANALSTQDVDVLKILLARREVNPNVVAQNQEPPLVVVVGASGGRGPASTAPFRIVATRGAVPATELLLEFGADVNRMGGPAQEAAIHRAAQGDDLEVIRVLAKHGAQLDVKNGAGLTPYDLAAGKRPAYKGPKDTPVVRKPPEPKPEMMTLIRQLTAQTHADSLAKAQP